MSTKRGKKRDVPGSTIRFYPNLESRCNVRTPEEIRQLLEDAFSAGESSADAKRKRKDDAEALEVVRTQAADSEEKWIAAHGEFALATEAVKAALAELVNADQADDLVPSPDSPGPLAKAAAKVGDRPKAASPATSPATSPNESRRR